MYHLVDEGEAHGTSDVKKLSKERESAADQRQMKSTSDKVCVSFPDVVHKPTGRPKYSSCKEKSVDTVKG